MDASRPAISAYFFILLRTEILSNRHSSSFQQLNGHVDTIWELAQRRPIMGEFRGGR